ncbi:MAG: protein-tyrosine-phosphatase [Flavobacteriales bacterium]
MKVNSSIRKYIEQLDVSSVSIERRQVLSQIADLLLNRKDLKHYLFVCTHNSRRSQLAQAWFAMIAHAYGVDFLDVHSAGTEATAFYPSAIETLKQAGMVISIESQDDNPKVTISFSEEAPSILAFSKTLDHGSIPKEGMVAVMTCGHADQNCPMVLGAEVRISLNYIDPKWSDNTEEEQAIYMACSQLIATEIKFIFDSIAKS